MNSMNSRLYFSMYQVCQLLLSGQRFGMVGEPGNRGKVGCLITAVEQGLEAAATSGRKRLDVVTSVFEERGCQPNDAAPPHTRKVVDVAEQSEPADAVEYGPVHDVEIAERCPVSDRYRYVKQGIHGAAIIEVDHSDQFVRVVHDHVCHPEVVVADQEFIRVQRGRRDRFCWEIVPCRRGPLGLGRSLVLASEFMKLPLMGCDIDEQRLFEGPRRIGGSWGDAFDETQSVTALIVKAERPRHERRAGIDEISQKVFNRGCLRIGRPGDLIADTNNVAGIGPSTLEDDLIVL